MLTFLTVALLVYGSMHLYGLGKAWLALPHSPALAAGLAVAGVVLTLSPFLVWFLEKRGWSTAATASAWLAYNWMGFLFLFVCLGLVLDLGHGLAALLRLPWPLGEGAATGAAALVALVLVGYGFLEARHIRVEEVRIATPKLAAGQVTIAQVSDLHLGIMLGDRFLDRVIGKLREIHPDILVATGDTLDSHGDDLAALARRFRTCAPPLGTFAVTGNHEYLAGLESSLAFLREAGFTILRGDVVRVGGIVLAGVDDHGGANPPLPVEDSFVVLLKHQPKVDGAEPFDLQLSGHVHGGQIFPFGYLTRLFYPVPTGLTVLEDGRQLYVSRGTGTWGPPLRLLAPPEITLITITAAR